MAIRDKYADERRTEIVNVSGEVDIEDLIPENESVITLSQMGYIKRVVSDEFALQNRGGRGKKTGARVLNRATQTKRPPGSSIKPISVYAPAIEYGLITPFSVEDDAPITVLNNSAYPKNETRTYSGRTNINVKILRF